MPQPSIRDPTLTCAVSNNPSAGGDNQSALKSVILLNKQTSSPVSKKKPFRLAIGRCWRARIWNITYVAKLKVVEI